MIGVDEISELAVRDTKKRFVVLVRGVYGVAIGVGDATSVRFSCKGGSVATPPGDPILNFTKGAREHCGVRFMNAVAPAADMDDKESQRTKS